MKTPDTLRQGFQKLLGSIIYITSSFYRFVFYGSLLSTLDLSLFCIVIIHPLFAFCKMGCSISNSAKSWRN